ncbi:MAG: lysine-sensitive aspartokinase 3 [Bacteriovoracaceae bacterium]|nr:lysine-sensitive aspartokinase 3 [Bacteriovoracaceae bacterium]
MKLIVSKFGGTSMGSAEAMRRSAVISKRQGAKIIVVSATSGTTNKLIELARVAEKGDWESSEKILFELRERHFTIGKELSITTYTQTAIEDLLNNTETLARGIHLMRECSPRAFDRMQSFGERLSSLLFTEALAQEWPEFQVKCLDVRTVLATDSIYGKATPLIEKTKENATKILGKIREQKIAYVTQGFIGMDPQGHTTTLGRGGSDYSASLLGEAVGADIVEIWTDVDGIATTDPRLHKGARAIRDITFKEAAEMAVFGAKVLHPTTLTPAMRQDIPVFVGSSFEPEKAGTWIRKEVQDAPTFRAVALKKDQALVTLSTPKMLNTHGFLSRVFGVFEQHRVSVDAITTSEISIAMTIDRSMLDHQELFTDLRELGEVTIEEGFSLVSLIGNSMNHKPGLAVKIFGAIEDVNVRMICLGASKHNFCVLVHENQGPEVVSRLHTALIEA